MLWITRSPTERRSSIKAHYFDYGELSRHPTVFFPRISYPPTPLSMRSTRSAFPLLAATLALLSASPLGFAQELPEGWTALGCYSDTAAPRTLGAQVTVNAAMTVERCIATCDAADYKYAGLEFGSECDPSTLSCISLMLTRPL